MYNGGGLRQMAKLKWTFIITMLIMFVFGFSVSFAFFTSSVSTNSQVVTFGKLRLEVKDGVSQQVINLNLNNLSGLTDQDVLTLDGYVGTEENSVNSFIRMKPNITVTLDSHIESELTSEQIAETKSTFISGFVDAFTSLPDVTKVEEANKNSATKQWYKVGDYYYYGNVFTGGDKYVYGDNEHWRNTISMDGLATANLQGASVTIAFTYQAIQASHAEYTFDDNGTPTTVVIADQLGATASQANANLIARADAWESDAFLAPLPEINNLNVQVIANSGLVNDNSVAEMPTLSNNNPTQSNLMADTSPRQVAVGGNSSSAGAITIPEYVKFRKGSWYLPADGESFASDYATDETIFKVTKIAYVPTSSTTTEASALSSVTTNNNAFSVCKSAVTGVIIPSTVSSLQEYAFYGTAITNITIPSSVDAIPQNAFDGSSVSSVTLPNNLTSVGSNAFARCSNLKTITIPNGVNYQNEDYKTIFTGSQLQNVTAPHPDCVVGQASSLVTLHITDDCYPSSANGDSIYQYESYGHTYTTSGIVFYGFTHLTSITFDDVSKWESVPSQFAEGCTSLSTVSLSNTSNITSIGSGAFKSCSSLTSFTLPSNLQYISGEAFYNCGLTSVNVPSNVMVDGAAYYNCPLVTCTLPDYYALYNSSSSSAGERLHSSLTNATFTNQQSPYFFYDSVSAGSGHYTTPYTNLVSVTATFSNADMGYSGSDFGLFAGCTTLTTLNLSGTFESYVPQIKSDMCKGCSSLTNLTLPSNYNYVGDYAFYGCNLNSITLPNTLQYVGSYAFYNCTGVTSFPTLTSVQQIGEYAFYGCTNLTGTLTLTGYDSSSSGIGECAFTNTGLTQVSLTGIGCGSQGVFYGCPLTRCVVPDVYCLCSNSSFSTNLFTSLQYATFTGYYSYWPSNGCGDYNTNSPFTNLRELSIGFDSNYSTPSILSGYTFKGCTNLTSVTFNGGISNPYGYDVGLGYSCFEGCTGLTSIVIPTGVTEIQDSCFKGCSNLTSVTIPDTVTRIGGHSFQNCHLSSVTIPSMIREIGNEAFSGNTGLSVTISGLENYDTSSSSSSSVFPSGTTFSSISIPMGKASALGLFGGCNITSLTLADCDNFNDTYIMSTIRITNLTISGGGSIPSEMFCTGTITTINLANSITSIGERAFEGQPFTSIDLSHVTSIEQCAFAGCGITSANLSSLQQVGERAFEGCNSLTSITLSSSLTSVRSGAFSGIPLSVTITYSGTTSEWLNQSNSFDSEAFPSETIITCQDGSLQYSYNSNYGRYEWGAPLCTVGSHGTLTITCMDDLIPHRNCTIDTLIMPSMEYDEYGSSLRSFSSISSYINPTSIIFMGNSNGEVIFDSAFVSSSTNITIGGQDANISSILVTTGSDLYYIGTSSDFISKVNPSSQFNGGTIHCQDYDINYYENHFWRYDTNENISYYYDEGTSSWVPNNP